MGPNQAEYRGSVEETNVNFKMGYVQLCYKTSIQTNILHSIKKGLTGSNYTKSQIIHLVQAQIFTILTNKCTQLSFNL